MPIHFNLVRLKAAELILGPRIGLTGQKIGMVFGMGSLEKESKMLILKHILFLMIMKTANIY